MATNPTFFGAAINRGAVTTPATLDTSTTAPTNTATVTSGGASGSKIELIRIMQVATTSAAGILNIFIYDGTNYQLVDWYAYGAVTLSTTVQSSPVDLRYDNLFLKSTDSLRVTVTTSAGQSAFKVFSFGGDA